MLIKEFESLKNKTTMKIGGLARFYVELETKEDVEESYKFALDKNIPLITFGAGSNTIFFDGTVNALVARIKTNNVKYNDNIVYVEAGKNLAQLVNELADHNLDFSPLTGIPGTIGGAIIGNAGQGPKGKWLNSFVESVTIFENGKWKNMTKKECVFSYRESKFKDILTKKNLLIIWSVILNLPTKNTNQIKNNIETLLKKRISDQPHTKTSGSCFKASDDGTPAWQIIEKTGLRGLKIGGVHISEKHANFLINDEEGNFEDVCKIIETVKKKAPDVGKVEMRLIGANGKSIY